MVVFLLGHNAQGQSDTVNISPIELADSVYGQIDEVYFPSGRLYNRLLLDFDSSFLKLSERNYDTVNVDYFYGVLNELRHMSLDTSSFHFGFDYFMEAQNYYAQREFDDGKVIVPMGIIDYEYQFLKEDSAITNGVLQRENLQLSEQSDLAPYVERKKAQLVAPMYDFVSDATMYLMFKEDWVLSNKKDSIKKIVISTADYDRIVVSFGEEIPFTPQDSEFQYITITVTYEDKSSFTNTIILRTPDTEDFSFSKANDTYCDGGTATIVSDNNPDHKLEYCFVNGCNAYQQNGGNGMNHLDKPFILVTGYRPPIFGQAFDKTFEKYSAYHDAYLQNLIQMDYDVILVRYNVPSTAQTHGLLEMSHLFEKFLTYINAIKQPSGDSYYENVIQGSSMGASIVRLALLRMEKKHFENNAQHHHSRLFISYDANYHGGNIPYSYVSMIYSQFKHQDPVVLNSLNIPLAAIPGFPILPVLPNPIVIPTATFLNYFLYASMEQRATKQLLRYHPMTANRNTDFPNQPHVSNVLVPQRHQLRQDYLNEVNANYSGSSFMPLPNWTRNVAVSLGRHTAVDNSINDQSLDFKTAGATFRDASNGGTKYYTASAKYSTSGFKIFHRKSFFGYLGVPFVFTNQRTYVKEMEEIDAAPGSNIQSFGNIITVSDLAFATLIATLDDLATGGGLMQFTHKPVVSALAINKNLWPPLGSMKLNLQDMGLMFTVRGQTDPNQDESDFFGYPNLGRPNDHFDITPFEAIYAGDKIGVHVDLKDYDYTGEITDFLRNEIEPWYLGLQNQDFGAQARTNYMYYGKYRARNVIYVGTNVTPKTDIGKFTIAPNGYLELRAGDDIVLEEGFETEFGARFDAMSCDNCYEACDNSKIYTHNDGDLEDISYIDVKLDREEQSIEENEKVNTAQAYGVKLYPNPNKGQLILEMEGGQMINQIEIFDLTGKQVLGQQHVNQNKMNLLHQLTRGTYIIRVNSGKQVITKKFTVL